MLRAGPTIGTDAPLCSAHPVLGRLCFRTAFLPPSKVRSAWIYNRKQGILIALDRCSRKQAGSVVDIFCDRGSRLEDGSRLPDSVGGETIAQSYGISHLSDSSRTSLQQHSTPHINSSYSPTANKLLQAILARIEPSTPQSQLSAVTYHDRPMSY
jgi:hypothetical protein